MKLLNNPDVIMYELSIVHHLPQMAVELYDVKDMDRVEHGEIIAIPLVRGTLKCEVFKPGGGRFVLKRMEFQMHHALHELTWFRKLLAKFFKLNDLNDYSSTRLSAQQVAQYICSELNIMEQDVVYHARGMP